MEWLGDLERLFATSLYPLRVPIAIGLGVALIGLIVLARRRGWFDAARRHPGRTAAAAVVLVATLGPIAWYLGSPLFIRSSLAEPAPAVVPAPSAESMASHDPLPSDAPAPSGDIEAPEGTRTGSFVGADEFHFGSGAALLLETEPGEWIVRFEDFSVRNGPDLFVYLSPDADGYVDGAIEVGPLKATDGSFNTAVPAGTNVGEMRSVVIWCKQFAVQFAAAALR
jgi:hypothetical protein